MPGGSGGSARAQLAEQCYVLWATAETGDDTRELVVAICQPAVEKSARVQPAGRGQRALSRCCHKQRLLEVHEALCQAAALPSDQQSTVGTVFTVIQECVAIPSDQLSTVGTVFNFIQECVALPTSRAPSAPCSPSFRSAWRSRATS